MGHRGERAHSSLRGRRHLPSQSARGGTEPCPLPTRSEALPLAVSLPAPVLEPRRLPKLELEPRRRRVPGCAETPVRAAPLAPTKTLPPTSRVPPMYHRTPEALELAGLSRDRAHELEPAAGAARQANPQDRRSEPACGLLRPWHRRSGHDGCHGFGTGCRAV